MQNDRGEEDEVQMSAERVKSWLMGDAYIRAEWMNGWMNV